MIYTFFLGTNAILSASEAVAFLKHQEIPFTVQEFKGGILRIETSHELSKDTIKNLGGTIRIAKDIASWSHIPTADEMITALSPLPAKWQIGIGSMGFAQPDKKIAISMKKAARTQGSKLSFVEPKYGANMLNAAQVIFNRLTDEPNAELIVLKRNEEYLLVKTVAIQDITTYEIRDTSRPARDARVGLLPPKLAQIMINLGLQTGGAKTIYDPFCGMGTILQESWNMDMQAFGSDASERMVEYSEKNLTWLAHHTSVQSEIRPKTFLHDVTQEFPEYLKDQKLTVVTEPFLGTPLSRPLSPTELKIFHDEVSELYRQFFKNIRAVLAPHSSILMLLPAPKSTDGTLSSHIPLPRSFIDEIMSFGYRKVQLVPQEVVSMLPSGAPDIVLYARPDALVAREVTLWETV